MVQTFSSPSVLEASLIAVVNPHIFSSPSALESSSIAAVQPTSPTVAAVTLATIEASIASIVSLTNTHQVISLKLTNTNYFYWMKSYPLGQGVFLFVDGSLSSPPPPHMVVADGSSF
jgi:hypothetical protein